jgi:hypothetical protein
MMATRIRTLNFLPEIFKTTTNSQFLNATLDQIVAQPNTKRVEGYVGSKFGYGVNAKDNYVTEPTKTRTDYQLDPGVTFLKKDTSTAQDFISYPGIIDGLALEGAVVSDNNRLFTSQFYSWDSFTNLDKIINFNQYYWLAEGPDSVTVSTETVYNATDYTITSLPNGYLVVADGAPQGSTNPILTLLRGGTYRFTVDQSSDFWIQGMPGVTGYDPAQPNVQTRDVLGVDNNGTNVGIVTFTVPFKNAQDEYNFPGNNRVDLVSTLSYSQVNGVLLSSLTNGIDGITSLEGLTVMFYDSSVTSNYYTITYTGSPSNPTITLVTGSAIPTEQKITANYGTEWIGRSFYLDTSSTIVLIPYLSAILDTLYYQDGTSANKVGQIRLIASNTTNRIDVLTDIIGRKNYTAPNGVVFTNGLKVTFSGDIYPSSYENVQYYVEGVGTAIELVPVATLIAPEPFTSGTYIPYDTLPYDIGNYDSNLYIPVTPDYITIARNSIDQNAWSRSNRWFHIDVINATATYNNNPNSISVYATADNKAKRPIIEFYPNLRLFNSGVIGKNPIDFIDFRTTNAFNQVAGQENYYPDVEVYTDYTATIDAVSVTPVVATTFIVGRKYEIAALGTTTQSQWNTIAGTTGVTYAVGNTFTCVAVGVGTGTGIKLSTLVHIDSADIVGAFQVGQYINDSTNLLPLNSQITAITGTTTLTLTVTWTGSQTVGSTSVASLIANDVQNNEYALFDGARIVFAADTTIKNKIYVVRFSSIVAGDTPTITLTEANDGLVLPDEQTFTFRGYNYKGEDFYFDGINWILGQQKTTVNQPPLFDVFDENSISFGNGDIYVGSSFVGNKLFAYGLGSGLDDPVLGFPVRYSSVDNVGDISFDVSLNLDTFDYVSGTTPITQKVNTGYVYNYSDLTTYARQLGWQTAVGPSVQNQIFQFNYYASNPTSTYTCDIAKLNDTASEWPTIQVFVNNVIQQTSDYTVTVTDTQTIVNFTVPEPLVDTIVEILLLSDQVSKTAYYQVPINLNNNPLNGDITIVNVGDIRGQYQSIFYNNPNTTGTLFGSNNYRDLGNLVPYGNAIIQNSASLVLPGTFLRKQNHNLFNSLLFNSREYITFKSLLVDTVNNTDYSIMNSAATMLDDALDKITASKTESASFFWSDMLPSKAAFITNTYSFANSLDVSIYPLSKVYNFATANYNGVLVYLTNSAGTVTQLIRNTDYTVSTTAPSLTVTLSLSPGDQITIKEYNQTYGSYVPNTPTKLGLYPATIPNVTLDTAYLQPTYFIVGHDGSYNKLYGDYIDGKLIDFRDQVLLEYEKRIYNNLKLSNTLPIQEYEILPGFFRDTDYSYDEILQIYSTSFLDWVGQNRINYKTQFYSANNEYSFNYNTSGNKINREVILQGYWRGIYEYFYDTSNPDTRPWEMLGFTNQPTWWETRYGPAPYTSDNLVLWGDLAAGIDWNNGDPIVIPSYIRAELLQVLPVDTAGNLVSPFVSIVGNYSNTSFNRDWKVGDVGPAEFSYRRSSSWPFDLMRILALTKPAEFFNLGVDIDNYKYNEEFNQYLVNNRSHLVISDVEIYGNGIAKTSYINWIVDYEKQVGIDATTNIVDLLDNIDVRLVYRLAGFSDKNLLKFYVEKSTANSNNSSLLIPDESYQVLLYDNQPFDRIIYSGVVVQITDQGYYKVYGNSQTNAYFKILAPKINGNFDRVSVQSLSVQLAKDYYTTPTVVAYGTEFFTVQEVAQFLESYGRYLVSQGVLFDQIESGLEVSWRQMVAEYLYWAQSGWEPGSIVNINPASNLISINKDSYIVQPLTLQRQNFVLNQNLYPIQNVDLSIVRDGTIFTAQPLNQGDTIAYGQFNISNFEHGIVFDNVTLFNDIIYNLITGLRQNRITLRGTKTAEWNGTIDAQGFILNQDNILDWDKASKYTTGSIVKYKNKYWIASSIIQPSTVFEERKWVETDYNEIQKGLLPNTSTRSFESTIYYDVNRANLENDADLLSFSLIGYRPRDYLALADLTDITQINVYKNFIKNKGTLNAVSAFKGANLPQGGIDYDIYENWAIKSGEFGGVLNSNFIDFKLNQNLLTGNPSIVGLTNGISTAGVQQEVPLYSLYNYGRPITSTNVLPLLPIDTPSTVFPTAGYANFNDVRIAAYYYNNLSTSTSPRGILTPLSELYVGQYIWLADYQGTWQVMTPVSLGSIIFAKNNLNGTATITFNNVHGLSKYQPFAVVNFNDTLNGYYIVNSVIDPFSVLVNVTLDPGITTIIGQGIGFKFQSQRVAKPSDIINLPLLNTEFVKTKVWVDTNNDGNWAVYRKSINYGYDSELVKDGSETFGSAVAYTDSLGYLIGDADAGIAYRYSYNSLFERYDLMQTLTGTASFGTTIAYSNDIFVISQPTGATTADRTINIYQLVVNTTVDELQSVQSAIQAPAGVTSWGSAIAISGDTNWLYISDIDNNSVHVYNKSPVTDEYEASYIIDGDILGLTTAGDQFGYSLSTDYYGDTLVVGTPAKDYDGTTSDWGYTYVFDRTVQNIQTQFTSFPDVPQTFTLAWTPTTTTITVTASDSVTDRFSCASSASLNIGDPIVFTGTVFGGISLNTVYYILAKPTGTTFTVATSRGGSTLALDTASGSMSAIQQDTLLYVSVNGTSFDDSTYYISSSTITIIESLTAGDIITVSGNNFVLAQTLTTETTPKIGVQFGTSVDSNTYATEILVGAPFELNSQNQEGAVYRYTNGGGKYGMIIGTSTCNISTSRTILINGYRVVLTSGDATTTAQTINQSNISNVQATAIDGKLIISLIDNALASINDKLNVTVLNNATWAELGFNTYTQTQVINDPHVQGTTQFGNVVKFNEFNSFVVSAPTATRYVATTFDASDDENYDNDTLFDNNATQWVDTYPNAGAVYMFDYLSVYNESLLNCGNFVYAQSVNDINQTFGNQPLYGHSIDFNASRVVIGTPNFEPDTVAGQIVTYVNSTGEIDWSVYRSSSPVVDIDRIQNIQLYSALTNNTLDNLDYIDPLQGKILGAIRQNIDVVSNVDPAGYNSPTANKGTMVWGSTQVGQIWFNTSTTKFVNYHQNDVVYNSKWWGQIFPGSDVTVYSWITSDVPPISYAGQGTPYDVDSYAIEYVLNSVGVLTPIYFYWVRNTNIIFTKIGKTLSDSIIQSYIVSPINSGISYFAPLEQDIFALYNCSPNINANDTVLHIGFSTGVNDDVSHSLYNLIRTNYADDFLPGLPNTDSLGVPESLYDRMLDSLCGVDESGGVVPDPYLPKPVQYGIYARPRQSFFVNRFLALKNYLTYANEVLAQYPITETRRSLFLFTEGATNPSTVNNPNWPGSVLPFYATPDYWTYINWWAVGYDDNTKSALQVPIYADLATINASAGLIVTVKTNGDGKSETYIYTDLNIWERIGLQDGTIQLDSSLWDYSTARLGFGDNFYDTTPYDTYPSQETRSIVRALNEEIYTNELLIFRNKSLILLFEYIQSETIESQNYLPWLNKTSFIDVGHTIRELLPLQVFRSDNQDFLAGYINEVKPYHVVVKEFLFKYTGSELYAGTITDFDLPAQYNTDVQQFITPELVYANPSAVNQYLPTDPIWQTSAYSEWYNNYGLSITGVNDYQITVLASYISLNSPSFAVDNAFGFPINGTILIGDELIGYSNVDRSNNTLSGLTRGVDGTPVTVHIPGEIITINLPAVLLLNGGRGYIEPPRVTAYIDTTIYPAPRRPAVLQVVMNLDSILRVDVIDPGEGYVVLPEILIDPSISITFASNDVNYLSNTIVLPSSLLQTGDLVTYTLGSSTTSVGGLEVNQYYYVNVLESSPVFNIALYTTYSDAINDNDRVVLYNTGSGVNNILNISARASCVTSAIPIRENQITLRFDRTSYTSQVTDWQGGAFYGSFYAGLYNNSERIASSSINLQSTQPTIDNILASAQGAVFEIEGVTNDQVLEWSSRTRNVVETIASTDVITIEPSAGGAPDEGYVGPTLGFYVNMPVKFQGAVGTSNLINGTTYYVKEILNETDFTISATVGGSIFALGNATISTAGLLMYVGEVTNTAIVTLFYPGILTATATTSSVNSITIPQTASGLGGTTGFYPTLPVFFTGDVFGGIIENETYYITTVIDDETFTMSTSDNPTILDIVSTGSTAVAANALTVGQVYSIVSLGSTDWNVVAGTSAVVYSIGNVITVAAVGTGSGTASLNYITCSSETPITDFVVNDQVIFTDLVVATGSTNIVAGTTYYISSVLNSTQFIISSVQNGGQFNPGISTLTGNVTNQKSTVSLTTASGTMTCNVGIPVSPGQVTGQQFTFYSTSSTSTYVGLTGTNGNLVTRTIDNALADGDYLSVTSLSGGLTNIYNNMPVTVASTYGGLTGGATYYVVDNGIVEAEVSATNSIGNVLSCNSTAGFYSDMPISFTDTALGGIVLDTIYYVVGSSITSTTFQISTVPAGSVFVLTTDSGSIMTATGQPYIKVSATLGGGVLALSNETSTVIMTQAPTAVPEFDVSWILGGYRVNNVQVIATSIVIGKTYTIVSLGTTDWTVISGITPVTPYAVGDVITAVAVGTGTGVGSLSGKGYTVNNTITIPGNLLGGTIPANNLVMTVNTIGTNGQITSVICSGTPNALSNQYYLKVISATECEVYSDPLLQIPVSGINFPYLAGDYSFLPEPFYFNQSIVKYNNRVYQCIVSNNDTEFIFGKWELLSSDSRKLNALDRIIGYYQPTINMPGVDLTQLVDGITYPNSTYQGNAFPPADEYELDTILQDQLFSPAEVDTTSIAHDGVNYIASANTPTYSIVLTNTGTTDWNSFKITEQPVGLSDIGYFDGLYIMSSTNTATPIFVSDDSISWATTGLVAGSVSIDNTRLNSVAYLNGRYVAVGDNIVSSTTGYTWVEGYNFIGSELFGVAGIDITNFTGFVVVGYGPDYSVIPTVTRSEVLVSLDGLTWTNVTPAGSSETMYGVTSGNDMIIIVGNNGSIFKTINGSNWTNISTGSYDLTDITYSSDLGLFVAIGQAGAILTSIDDGVNWTDVTDPLITSENLNSIIWNATDSKFIIVGNNNVILESTDGAIWTNTGVFTTLPTVYDVQGDAFTAGYGPEELVPGVVSDNLTMIVTTRPGTNWDVETYQHVGYNVVSTELTPTVGQVIFEFNNLVENPAQLSVFQIDSSTGLSTRLYSPDSFTIDWILKTITLNTSLPAGDKLFVEVYETGNGDQLEKSNSQSDPIRLNETTGFNEIFLNCNYTATRTSGSGAVRPTTVPINVVATATDSVNDTILCEDVSSFTLNDQITFQGAVFGGVVEDTHYYVKTVSTVTNKITISDTIVGGTTAGPTFALTTDSGSMDVVVENGTGTPWTDPIVYHNGTRLTIGHTTRITKTSSSTNSITCNTTAGMTVGESIVFSNTMFGNVITPQTVYYIKSIVDNNEFTISATSVGGVPGPTLSLSNATGGAIVITNDYAFGIAPNGISAVIIFSAPYDDTIDYLSYTVFGETFPSQYGYTLPENEVFTATAGQTVFNLINYVSGDNPNNAIVELNGVRLINTTDYTISSGASTLTLVNPALVNDIVAITSFNLTERQYFNTQYNITSKTVSSIINIDNEITPPIVFTSVTATTAGTNLLTCPDTSGFIVDQTIIFNGISFGGVATDGTVYYVKSVTFPYDGTFTISQTLGGSTYSLTTDTGNMLAYVGGIPAVRVTTATAHNLTTNDIIRIDGTLGSVQLNNNTYYVHVINSTQVDLYNSAYSSSIGAVNTPVTEISTYTSGGYIWEDELFVVVNDWEQSNVDRLWVTINGYRVPSSALYLNADNNLSILASIVPADVIIITSMISSATPNQLVYLQNVNKNSVGSVYRANSKTKTWLVQPVYYTDTVIYVSDVTRITDEIIQNVTAPAAVNGITSVGLTADKNIISQVVVYNNTTSAVISPVNYDIVIIDLSPILEISGEVTAGDSLTITTLEGNLLYINGEQIKFTTVNPIINAGSIKIGQRYTIVTIGTTDFNAIGAPSNTVGITFIAAGIGSGSGTVIAVDAISGLQRGTNGTGELEYIPLYSEVFGILSTNLLPSVDYDLTWNSNTYNVLYGDPLQISDTPSAIFLNTDIS